MYITHMNVSAFQSPHTAPAAVLLPTALLSAPIYPSAARAQPKRPEQLVDLVGDPVLGVADRLRQLRVHDLEHHHRRLEFLAVCKDQHTDALSQ